MRIELVFGHMTNSMGSMFIRCIVSARVESAIVLKNLTYNISPVNSVNPHIIWTFDSHALKLFGFFRGAHK